MREEPTIRLPSVSVNAQPVEWRRADGRRIDALIALPNEQARRRGSRPIIWHLSPGVAGLRMQLCWRHMIRRLVLVVVAILSVAGCDSAPTAPSAATLEGTWSGTISDPVAGNGTARVTLSTEAQFQVRGTWSATFSNGATASGLAGGGPVGVGGYMLTLYADPPPSCDTNGSLDLLSYQLINLSVTSSRFTATSLRLSCSGPGFGSLNLTRQ